MTALKGYAASKQLGILCCVVILSTVALLSTTGFTEWKGANLLGACGWSFCTSTVNVDEILRSVQESSLDYGAQNLSVSASADESGRFVNGTLVGVVQQASAVGHVESVAETGSTNQSRPADHADDSLKEHLIDERQDAAIEDLHAADKEFNAGIVQSQPENSGAHSELAELLMLEEDGMQEPRKEASSLKPIDVSERKGQGDPSIAISIGGHRKHWERFSESLQQAGGTSQVQVVEEPEEVQEPRKPKSIPNRPFPDCPPEQLVYIYELPAEYNLGLFGLDGPFGSPCQTFLGHHPRNACRVYDPLLDGHGPPLSEKESLRLRQLGTLPEAWADTGQFALEVMFHRYLDQYYPCRTWDPSQAAAFYVPAYMGISLIYNWEAICETSCDIQTITAVEEGVRTSCEITCSKPSYLRGFADGLLEEMNRLPYLQRRQGADHIITAARVMYDYTREWTCCTTGILALEQLPNMMKLGWENGEGMDRRYHISIPYPTCFHPASQSDIDRQRGLMRAADRTLLVSFAGKFERKGLAKGAAIRRKLKEQCDRAGEDCSALDCFMECECSELLALQLRSQFCLQPPGDTDTRRSTFDALQAGCIPVLFSRASAYTAYQVFLPPDETSYSVFVSESDYLNGDIDIVEHLRSIPLENVQRMRGAIADLLPRITYSNYYGAEEGSAQITDFDAYRVTMNEALQRIQDRQTYGY